MKPKTADAPNLFTLLPGRWYAWEMIPGYGDEVDPYFSPIRIERIHPLHRGTGDFRLSFFNACYAAGVQNFDRQMRVMKRAERFMVVDLTEPGGEPERVAVIGHVTMSWLRRFVPALPSRPPLSGAGSGRDAEIDELLDRAFGIPR